MFPSQEGDCPAGGGAITLLRVVTHPRDAVAYLLQPPAKAGTALEGHHAQSVDYLTYLASSGELAGVGTALEVADSGPAQTTLSAARLQQVDSIVMCSHGTTGFKRWALGSVAQKVTRQSPVPALCSVRRKMRRRPFTIQKPLMLYVSWWLSMALRSQRRRSRRPPSAPLSQLPLTVWSPSPWC